MQKEKVEILVETFVKAAISQVWNCWTQPEHITGWNFASDEWCSPRAVNDVRPGGEFNWRMEAKDGSAGFDFTGKYTAVIPLERLDYLLDDDRQVSVRFISQDNGVKVIERFEAEQENTIELQKLGWGAILENFRKYTEKAVDKS